MEELVEGVESACAEVGADAAPDAAGWAHMEAVVAEMSTRALRTSAVGHA